MSTQEQARALMMRHHHLIKNREQSMLNRAASEIGLDHADGNQIQDKLHSSLRVSYDRRSGSMS